MSSHLRRYVTSPLAIFEYEFASETRAPPPLAAAAKTLALCIKVSASSARIWVFLCLLIICHQLVHRDDFVMSNMQFLLKSIDGTNQEVHDVSGGSPLVVTSTSPLIEAVDESNPAEPGMKSLSEDQKNQIEISTISVVTRLALEFRSAEARAVLNLSDTLT